MQLKLNIIYIYQNLYREMGNKTVYIFVIKKNNHAAEICYIVYVYCHHYLVALGIRKL